MKKVAQLALLLILLALPGCSSKFSDATKLALSFFALNQQSSLVLISNSATETTNVCTSTNRVLIQKSFTANKTAYCREISHLGDGLNIGEICPGGVTLNPLTISSEVKTCDKITLCGKTPSATTLSGTRTDGGKIENLEFTNLPWGCDARLEASFDPSFSPESVTKINVFVQPPECPFCARQNRTTCLPCRDLDSTEVITAGQVVHTTCPNGVCKKCEVLNKKGTFVDHGAGMVYYKVETGACGLKCSAQSLLRMCSDGNWQGDPSYQFPECYDTACACKIPGDPIDYTHLSVKTLYQSNSPACGVDCSTQSKQIKCLDGEWWTTSTPANRFSSADFQTYPAGTCSKRICHCERPARQTIADGQTRSVYSKSVVSCTETCGQFKGDLTCKSGTLTATNLSFLGFEFDSCSQEDCGCNLTLPDNSNLLIADGGQTTLYQYDRNTASVPDACSNPQYQTKVSCNDRVLSNFDSALFQFKSCSFTPQSCTFIEGNGNRVTVDHNKTLAVSKTATPACGEVCDNQTFLCENTVLKKRSSTGTWVPLSSTDLSSYKVARACTPKNCDCNLNGYVVAFGATDPNFYNTDKVTDCNPNGCTAAKAAITCTANGPISSKGDDAKSYKYKSCQFIPCGCRPPWGGVIENGKSIKVYSTDKGTCSDNACNQEGNSKLISCSNGAFNPSYDESLFKYPTCSPAVCECTHGTQKIPIGQTLRVYKSENPLTETCPSISTLLTCTEGGLWTGGDPLKYPYTSCRDLLDDGIGGGSGGGTGNDEGPGAALKKRFPTPDGSGGPGDPCTCGDVRTCRTNIIDVTIKPYERQFCELPWGNSAMEHYGTIAAFDTQCVVPPDKCSNHRSILVCDYPSLLNKDTYKYPSCEERSSCP